MYPYAIFERNRDGERTYISRPDSSIHSVGESLIRISELAGELSEEEALWEGFVLFLDEDDAYHYWQRESSILSDRNGLCASGQPRWWQEGTLLDVLEGRVSWPEATGTRLLWHDLQDELDWRRTTQTISDQVRQVAEIATAGAVLGGNAGSWSSDVGDESRWDRWVPPKPSPYAFLRELPSPEMQYEFERLYRGAPTPEPPRGNLHALRLIAHPILLVSSGIDMLGLETRCETCRRDVTISNLDAKHHYATERLFFDNEPIRGRGIDCEDVLREQFGFK